MTPTDRTDEKFLCDQCDYQGLTKQQLRSHQAVHTEKKFHCIHCDYKATTKSKLIQHNLIHEGQKSFICDHPGCTYSSVLKGNLNKHLLTHSDGKPYECSLCKEAFRYQKQLQNHVSVHKGKKHLCCPVESCHFSTHLPVNLRTHMCTHTGEKRFKCDFEGCEYSCIQKQQLRIHSYKHGGEKPLKCSFKGCNFTCVQRDDLNRHFRKHTGEKPYACKIEGCGYSFSRVASLRNHQLQHLIDNPGYDHVVSQLVSTPRKRSKCKTALHNGKASEKEILKTMTTEKCQSVSDTNNSRTKTDAKVVTKPSCDGSDIAALKNSPKKYICKICDFGTKKKQKYKDHLQSHTELVSLMCSICDFSCFKKKLLKIHMRTHLNLPDENNYFPDRPNPGVLFRKKDFSLIVSMSSLKESSSQNSQSAINVPNIAEKDTGLPVIGIKRSVYQCRLCEFRSKKKSKYKVHLEWHRVKGCLFCLRCDFVSFKEEQLQTHFREHNAVPVQRRV